MTFVVSLFVLASFMAYCFGAPAQGVVSEVSSFEIPKSPSGMFFDSVSGLLYILCGTATNDDHFLYAFTTDGEERCLLTIPKDAGMSRVDGFYIVDSKAYIVDSQGPIYKEDDGKLGGSIYEVEWDNPCGCQSDGTCSESAVSWSPTVLRNVFIDAGVVSDGGGNDDFFRNSGIVVQGDTAFAVNGVHPSNAGDLTCCYPKSLIKVSLADDDSAGAEALSRWPFSADTIGHDVDMEGLTCGADACADNIYIGDEWNYIYRLNLADTDSASAITVEWDVRNILGDGIPADKGIESLTFAPTTGFFYAGIQETARVHVLELREPLSSELDAAAVSSCGASAQPACAAPAVAPTRVRRELRSLSASEFSAVVDAFWLMKNTSMADGVARYGANFKPYDYFVVRHAYAQTDTRGDQAHFGPHFMTWHIAFNLEFELSLLAIDPTIGAMPYWDQTDASTDIFVDSLLGSADLSDDTEKQLRSGVFADWPISSSDVLQEYAQFIDDETTLDYSGSPGGFLRGGDNTLATQYNTRFGSSQGRTYDANGFLLCATADKTWQDQYRCLESGFHSGPHPGIGGKSGSMRGDFEDPVTSPNDPLFFFHHFNMERSTQMYQIQAQSRKCDYWDYTRVQEPAFYGTALEEVMSSGWGFTSQNLGLAGVTGAPTGLWTNADVLCWLNPSSAGYTYDTVVACKADPQLCVGEVATTTGGTTPATGEATCSGTDDRGMDCAGAMPRMGRCPPGCQLVQAAAPANTPANTPADTPAVDTPAATDDGQDSEITFPNEDSVASSVQASLLTIAALLAAAIF